MIGLVEAIWMIAGVGAAAALGYVFAKSAMPAVAIPTVELPDIAGAISAGITPFKEFAGKTTAGAMETMKQTTSEAMETVRKAVGAIPESIGKIKIPEWPDFSGILDAAKEKTGPVLGELTKIGEDWYKWTGSTWEKVQEAAKHVKEDITLDLDKIREQLGTGIGKVENAVGGIKDTIGKYTGAPQKITTVGFGIGGALGGAKLGSMIGTGIVPGIGTLVGGALGALVGWLMWE